VGKNQTVKEYGPGGTAQASQGQGGNRVRSRRKRFGPLAKGALALAGAAVFVASTGPITHAGNNPSQALFAYYDVGENTGVDDNILRLVNPVGSANNAFLPSQNLCAMIYVFDDDQEMGECCGCPITPAQMVTFSVEDDLISNWGLFTSRGVDKDSGTIAIRSAAPNETNCISFITGKKSPACNGGCDPGIGYNDNPALLGSITHPQLITGTTGSLTEVELFADGQGDPTNRTYLIRQCAALVGNATGAATCSCPEE